MQQLSPWCCGFVSPQVKITWCYKNKTRMSWFTQVCTIQHVNIHYSNFNHNLPMHVTIILCCAFGQTVSAKVSKRLSEETVRSRYTERLPTCQHWCSSQNSPHLLDYRYHYQQINTNEILILYTRVSCDLWSWVIAFPPFSECVR